jgi:hypothetical protein
MHVYTLNPCMNIHVIFISPYKIECSYFLLQIIVML